MPRIAYWTSSFEPHMEAVASEVAVLRRHFSSSVAWGLSHRHWALLSWRRGYCLHPRLHLLFRLVTRLLGPAFEINHIFGSLGDWFYLRGCAGRPCSRWRRGATRLTLLCSGRLITSCSSPRSGSKRCSSSG